jgi:thiamine transport system substrate-binding protein
MTPTARRTAALFVAGLTVAACSGSDDVATDVPDADEPATEEATESETPDTAAPDAEEAIESDSPEPGSATDTTPADASTDTTITLVTYESFPSEGTAINEQLATFSDQTGIDVEILVAGDTGTMLSKAELAVGNPEGDVMWGIDSTFLSRAIGSEIFQPYEATGLDAIPAAFTDLVPNAEATPVDFGDVCVNYDIGALDELGIDAPTTLDDLADPAYQDLLVVQNPATSSPGLAFLLATVDEYGIDGWQDYWQRLVDNGVSVTDGWSDAYYGQFSYAGGDRPLVVSYGSSPPVEVVFSDVELDAAPTGVVEATCYRQVEFVGVLAGTEQPDAAQQLVDFMITEAFQSTLPLDVFVFPANTNVQLDQVFVDFAVIPETSRLLDPDVVDSERETFIDQWTDLVIG